MISLAEQASNELRLFLNQRDDLVLVVQGADTDMPAGLKIVEAVEAAQAHVWSWVFAQPFTDALSYADVLTADIEQKQVAIGALLQRDGRPPLPVLPADLRDPTRDPVDRLRGAVRHVRSMVPQLPGAVTLFGLLPLTIGDLAAYGALVQRLVRHRMPFPWCAGVRFVIRGDAARPALAPISAGPRMRLLQLDFGPQALGAAAAREAADKDLPPERRAVAAIVSAGIDQAHGRPAEAEQQYKMALEHYGETGNAPMAAAAANGIAACREVLGDAAGAERIMLAALEASLQARPPALPVTLNILLDLTMLAARQGRWDEVELYATATRDVALSLVRPGVEAEALSRRGVAQLRLQKIEEAEESWRAAMKVADESQEKAQALTARRHLVRLLQRDGRAEDARLISAEIAGIERAANASSAKVNGA
jgi:tetratricopeptide (TPR) repeat protein